MRRIVAFANWVAILIAADETERAREQYPKLLAQVRRCAELGGTATSIYWQRVFDIGDRLGLAEAARTELRAALSALRAGPIGDDPEVASIAQVVEGL